MTRNAVDSGFFGDTLGGNLVAHGFDRGRRRPDKGHASRSQCIRKGGILGQKTVTRVHGVATRRPASFDDTRYIQVTFHGWRRPYTYGFVGHFHMQAVTVGLRVHGDGGDTHLACRPDDAAGDFAAIGNEYLLEHAKGADSHACAMGSRVSCSRAWQGTDRYVAAWCSAG